MSVNLLPWRTQEITCFRKKCILFSLFFAIFFCAFFEVLHLFILQKINKIHDKNTLLNAQISKIPIKIIQNNQRLLNKLTLLQREKTAADAKNLILEDFLTHIANDLPQSITLTSLIASEKNYKLMGESNTLSDIHFYAQTLQKNLKKNKVILSDIQNTSQDKALFNFSLQILP